MIRSSETAKIAVIAIWLASGRSVATSTNGSSVASQNANSIGRQRSLAARCWRDVVDSNDSTPAPVDTDQTRRTAERRAIRVKYSSAMDEQAAPRTMRTNREAPQLEWPLRSATPAPECLRA